MKKSTLITTIAMIVVVVVALSTATYAWFLSAQYATANVTFSTQADGDWSIYKGTDGGEGAYTFGSAQSRIDYADYALANGLWSPTAKIESLTAATFTGATVANSQFFAADQIQNSTTTATVTTAAAAKDPIVVKVANVNSEAKQLKLTVIIDAGNNAASDADKFAAAAFSFNIDYKLFKASEDTVTGNVTNGYNTSSSITGSTATASNNTGTLDPVAASSTSDANLSALGKNIAVTSNLARPDYATAAGITFATATADDTAAFGVATGNYIIKYDITFDGTIAPAYGGIFVIYGWIDGWVAEASAKNAGFDVIYAFTSVA